MTLEELNGLRIISKRVYRLKRKLEDLRARAIGAFPSYDGMPRGRLSVADLPAEYVALVVDMEREILGVLGAYMEKEREIARWIEALPESEDFMKLVCEYRFLDGMRWPAIAAKMDTGEASLKVAFHRFFKRLEGDKDFLYGEDFGFGRTEEDEGDELGIYCCECV